MWIMSSLGRMTSSATAPRSSVPGHGRGQATLGNEAPLSRSHCRKRSSAALGPAMARGRSNIERIWRMDGQRWRECREGAKEGFSVLRALGPSQSLLPLLHGRSAAVWWAWYAALRRPSRAGLRCRPQVARDGNRVEL